VGEGELLTGDGVTQGIVRVGDTVRRLREAAPAITARIGQPA